MPVVPCAKKSLCLDPATPFQNLSAELPDSRIFIARNTGWGPHFPPLGSDWIAVGCTVFCVSTVSQDDADLCAAASNVDCLGGVWPITIPGFDVDGNPVPIPSRRPVYRNTPQSSTVTCPDGNPFTYTVPSGVFAAFDQFAANQAALSYAQQNASEFLLCISGLARTQICPDVQYTDAVTASGKFLDANTICWTIFGDLPPGIFTDIDDQESCFTGSLTLNFFGTPNTPGVYSFSVQAEDGLGNFMVKALTIRVMGIDGVDPMPPGETGVAYQEFLTPIAVTNPIYSLESGALPDGLALDTTGVIFGTPTVAGTFNFTLGITEAGTGNTCEVPASMEVVEIGTLNFNNTLWDNPATEFSTGTISSTFDQNSMTVSMAVGVGGDAGCQMQSFSSPGGHLAHDGSEANANLHIEVTSTEGTPPDTLTVQVTDFFGPILMTYAATTLGVFDIPFFVPAGVVQIEILFTVGIFPTAVITQVTVAATLTPAF